jgi:hypothetical protein
MTSPVQTRPGVDGAVGDFINFPHFRTFSSSRRSIVPISINIPANRAKNVHRPPNRVSERTGITIARREWGELTK